MWYGSGEDAESHTILLITEKKDLEPTLRSEETTFCFFFPAPKTSRRPDKRCSVKVTFLLGKEITPLWRALLTMLTMCSIGQRATQAA